MPKRKPRKVRPKKRHVPKGYDSMWEFSLHQKILKNWNLRGDVIKYIMEKTYEIDFVKQIGFKTVLLEAKGRFWDHAEYSKYIWLRKSLPLDTELVFLFQKPEAHSEWADKNKFTWYTEETLPESWR